MVPVAASAAVLVGVSEVDSAVAALAAVNGVDLVAVADAAASVAVDSAAEASEAALVVVNGADLAAGVSEVALVVAVTAADSEGVADLEASAEVARQALAVGKVALVEIPDAALPVLLAAAARHRSKALAMVKRRRERPASMFRWKLRGATCRIATTSKSSTRPTKR